MDKVRKYLLYFLSDKSYIRSTICFPDKSHSLKFREYIISILYTCHVLLHASIRYVEECISKDISIHVEFLCWTRYSDTYISPTSINPVPNRELIWSSIWDGNDIGTDKDIVGSWSESIPCSISYSDIIGSTCHCLKRSITKSWILESCSRSSCGSEKGIVTKCRISISSIETTCTTSSLESIGSKRIISFYKTTCSGLHLSSCCISKCWIKGSSEVKPESFCTYCYVIVSRSIFFLWRTSQSDIIAHCTCICKTIWTDTDIRNTSSITIESIYTDSHIARSTRIVVHRPISEGHIRTSSVIISECLVSIGDIILSCSIIL